MLLDDDSDFSSLEPLERLTDPTQRRATGFLLTTFQKLNASSTAAIRAALAGRLPRLKGQCEALPPPEETEPELG